ncbi:DUF4198 domain-containing protein [Flagellimonas sp.]|uniref:DUF4198 domain-containing protein n=1 Tax=Flagellimonas sp. TaxID=2058762 RepID=UPI003BB01758
MKKAITTLVLTLLTASPIFAHYLWIETAGTAQLGKPHEIKVFFGEYTYGVLEQVEGENFPKVANFELWLIAPDGTKLPMKTAPKDDHYSSLFTPTLEGTYTVVLTNNEIDVIDYTQYDFGIFKTHYHATSKIQVGTSSASTVSPNVGGLAINQLESSNGEIRMQVFYKKKPLPKNEFKIYMSDVWSKTLETDENGMVSFTLPWKTKYTMETTYKEEVPGKYKGEAYEFIWHCATYCIINN